MLYLSFSELRAKLCGRSRSAIYLDIESGRLPPPIKLGGKLYWPETEVDQWLLKDREVLS
jgi:prophage regulatory protein